MLLAKPKDDKRTGQPISLDDHTQNVRDEAARLLSARPFIIEKYARLTGKNLSERVDFCARWHDEGKKHTIWQRACRDDYEAWTKDPKSRGVYLMKSGIRHEMDSLCRLKQSGETYTRSDFVAIAAHHGKLSLNPKIEQRWQENDNGRFAEAWTCFRKWSDNAFDSLDPASFEAAILKRYLFDGPRAMLQLADHRASAREGGEQLPDVKPFLPEDYKFPFEVKRGVQSIIKDLWDEPLAILRAPTGAGKTDASLLWAQHQIEDGKADRLIIAMPTRFTSNALAINAAENLSQIGVYHSTAFFNRKEKEKGKANYNERWIEKEQELARQIETPVCVTTIDHLCIALTGAREDHHSIFWGLAHSCVVIDEADFYDEFTQYNLVTLLRALKVLDVRVLIMSATVPTSSQKLYEKSGRSIAKIYEDTSDLVRPRCNIHIGSSVEIPEDIADLLEKYLDGTPLIIYANTVKRAQAYVDWFKSRGFKDYVLYHSRFTEPDKAQKEEQLIERLGKEAWRVDEKTGKKQTAHGVAILTQIGELSVNISADVMISDLCPVDRLAQRAGRLSRFGNQVGQLYVVMPEKTDKKGEKGLYPAPYGTFKSSAGWEPAEALLGTQNWLKDGDINGQGWIDGVNAVYPSLKEPAVTTVTNERALRKSVIDTWMLVPAAKVGEDADSTTQWKSRDVPPQKKVYVNVKDPSMVSDDSEPPFENWRRFREWEQSHSVNILAYELNAGLKVGKIRKVPTFAGEEEFDIYVVESRYYSFERGLVLTEEQDEMQEDD